MNTIVKSVSGATGCAEEFDYPYKHYFLRGVFPADTLEELNNLTLTVPNLHGVSGKRELHNESRSYFNKNARNEIAIAESVADAFQSVDMIKVLTEFFNVDLQGTFLRLEYAQDVSGFWLEPHTDLGVKKITMLIYLNDAPAGEEWGTDIFAADRSHAKRAPYIANSALAFVPDDNTYHGFAKRPITGVRKSLILNYVTDGWRDRAQLAYPESAISAHPVGAA